MGVGHLMSVLGEVHYQIVLHPLQIGIEGHIPQFRLGTWGEVVSVTEVESIAILLFPHLKSDGEH